MATVLDKLTPEEITLLGSLVAIAITEDLTDDDATLLALFFSNVASSMGLFVEKRSREQEREFPGID